MQEFGKKGQFDTLKQIGLGHVAVAHWNYSPSELIEETLDLGMGQLTDTGALAIDTGEFTGRSPKDKFVVKDSYTEPLIWWGDVNQPFDPTTFDKLYNRVTAYLSAGEVYVRDCYACADENYRLNIRVVTELPWSNLFANNLFLRPEKSDIYDFKPDWHIINAPGFKADPTIDGTRQHNFTIIDFTRKVILIGGSGYTGEIKKGIFSVLNFILPVEHKVLSMHCSANVGEEKDVALFFGLSGTGKTTLSADPVRKLIGDDEHGWSTEGVFNFEGGCYAKCIDLAADKEPEIFNAIRYGALLENTHFYPGTRQVDYSNIQKTENTRVAYPIHHIENVITPSKAGLPRHIFFLTCDAFGVLPPISKLTKEQAMYHFISGYTAKVAGTEMGVTEPQTTFSACFGKAFLPLHPTRYAELLGNKLETHKVQVWLVNTGWIGGSYGVGARIKLKYTRALINAALKGQLDNVEYRKTPFFGLNTPISCPDVPSEILYPRDCWADKHAFDQKAMELAEKFVKNFEQFADFASEAILEASPKAMHASMA